MGHVLSLAEHRRHRGPQATTAAALPATRSRRAVFSFDLGDPLSYLAAERVDRLFTAIEWRPVLGAALGVAPVDPAAAEARAAALRLPLVWPHLTRPGSAVVRPAMRVAALAAERGRAPSFALAAGRLAFCGGFDLELPDVLAEAAAAADLAVDEALRAAADPARDENLEAAAHGLRRQGADRLPAVRVGRTLFVGEDRLGEAAVAARAASAAPSALRVG